MLRRGKRQRELAERLKASGALDEIFAQIDSGQVPLTGDYGLLKGMLKAALQRGLEVELTDHVGTTTANCEVPLLFLLLAPATWMGGRPGLVSADQDPHPRSAFVRERPGARRGLGDEPPEADSRPDLRCRPDPTAAR